MMGYAVSELEPTASFSPFKLQEDDYVLCPGRVEGHAQTYLST